jgi:hypothetical protein
MTKLIQIYPPPQSSFIPLTFLCNPLRNQDEFSTYHETFTRFFIGEGVGQQQRVLCCAAAPVDRLLRSLPANTTLVGGCGAVGLV